MNFLIIVPLKQNKKHRLASIKGFKRNIYCNPRVSRPALARNLTLGTPEMVTQECIAQEFSEGSHILRVHVTLVTWTRGKRPKVVFWTREAVCTRGKPQDAQAHGKKYYTLMQWPREKLFVFLFSRESRCSPRLILAQNRDSRENKTVFQGISSWVFYFIAGVNCKVIRKEEVKVISG